MAALSSAPLPETIGVPEIMRVMRKLQPRAFEGRKLRLGRNQDGGYVVPEHALACDAVLSIGIGDDVSFDHALAERGRFVLQFDHTLAAPPPPHENCLFEPRGWGAVTEGRFVTLADMVKVLTTVGASSPLLKFDVESAEIDLLDTLPAGLLATFPVIACELHELSRLGDRGFHTRWLRALDALLADHVVVHLHANNYGDLVLINGVPVPDAVELTLLRRDLVRGDAIQREPIPGPHDFPNDPNRFDLCLTPLGIGELAA